MKKIKFIYIFLLLLSLVLFPGYDNSNGLKLRFDSDSFGQMSASDGTLFIDVVSKIKGYELTNCAVGAQKLEDGWIKIKDEIKVPTTYDVHLINLGFNDIRYYGNTDNAVNDIVLRMKQIMTYLRLDSIKNSLDTAVQYSGTWNNVMFSESIGTTVNYTDKYNSSLKFSFSGNALSIGSYINNESDAGTIEIKIDDKIQYIKKLPNNAGSKGHTVYPINITNLSNGKHTCTITKVDKGKGKIYFDWYGVPSDNPPLIIINGITKMKTSAYLMYDPYNNGKDMYVNQANQKINKAVSEFDDKVMFVSQYNFDPNKNDLIRADQVHPNNLGHAWIAYNILNKLGWETEFSNIIQQLKN